MLEVGTKAPDFTLQNQEGKEVSLSDFKGKKVILYFYPKDLTSGLHENKPAALKNATLSLRKNGAVVIGISKDSVKKHEEFVTTYALPFTLLSDPEHKVQELYDVWKEKSLYGRKYMGTERSTYLIDEEGTIVKALQKVQPG